jgi:hypothetical protein
MAWAIGVLPHHGSTTSNVAQQKTSEHQLVNFEMHYAHDTNIMLRHFIHPQHACGNIGT